MIMKLSEFRHKISHNLAYIRVMATNLASRRGSEGCERRHL